MSVICKKCSSENSDAVTYCIDCGFMLKGHDKEKKKTYAVIEIIKGDKEASDFFFR